MSKKFVTILVVIWSVIIIALIGLLVFLFNSNNVGVNWFHNEDSSKYSQNFTQTYASSDVNQVLLGLSNADIVINKANTDEIKVDVKNNTKNKITCSKNGSSVEVTQESQPFAIFGFSFFSNNTVTVTVPDNYSKELILKTSSGDIKVTGDYDLEKFSSSSSSGSFWADDVKSPTIDIDASSGDIRAKKLSGDCTVKSSSGTIKIDNINGKGSFRTSSGDIYTGFETLTGDVDLNASSGTIRMGINDDADCVIDMSTSSGDINSNYETSGSRKYKTAKIGAGSYKVNIGTSSGDISLTK